ncbi:MAG: hypothetical protein ACKO0V_05785, partial [bacterium]
TLYQSGNCNFIETELLVIMAESWPIAKSLHVSFAKGLFLSLIANGVSASLGYCISAMMF